MNTPNGVQAEVARTADIIDTSQGIRISPDLCTPAEGNRVITMDTVSGRLLPSMAKLGQQVPGLVTRDPKDSKRWIVLDGSARLYCCGVLRQPFWAYVFAGEVSPKDLAKLRLSINLIRDQMSPMAIADDLQRIMKLEGCTQSDLIHHVSLGEAMISKVLRVSRSLAPEVRALVDDFTLPFSTAYLIATVPDHGKQIQLAREVVDRNLTRAAVETRVAFLRGKKPKKARPAGGRTAGGLDWRFDGDPKAMLAETEAISKALRKIVRQGWELKLLPTVMKGRVEGQGDGQAIEASAAAFVTTNGGVS